MRADPVAPPFLPLLWTADPAAEAAPYANTSGRHAADSHAKRSLGTTRAGAKAAPAPLQDVALQPAVPPLYALCLGVIGQYLLEYVEVLGDSLAWLPPEAKATLLAIAR